MRPSTSHRAEKDSLGSKNVPTERLWGAQTQRSLENFTISTEIMPTPVIQALTIVKKAAARVNLALGILEPRIAESIIDAADEILSGSHTEEFPLSVWQTGSGTQSNMNVNEVIANRASELLEGPRGEGRWVHPNDHVNLCQSSNDVFPTAMCIAAVQSMTDDFFPALKELRQALDEKAHEYEGIIKIGRTHLMDATPLTLGQEFSGYVAQLDHAIQHVESGLPHLQELALGGTAVGTGVNAVAGFSQMATREISNITGLFFSSALNKFEAVATSDNFVQMHARIKGVAAVLIKLCNDLRWMASGPRSGLGELHLPENEPGSSIMPGKTNPTQCEAVLMACYQVLGNDVTLGLAGASGNFELNVSRPVIIHAFLQSVRLVSDGAHSLVKRCIRDLRPNRRRIEEHLRNSLMLVTALAPKIGYDKASKIAQKANSENISLKEAAVQLGLVTAEDFDRWVNPHQMVQENPLKKSVSSTDVA
jgi:fumarate hydratase class II